MKHLKIFLPLFFVLCFALFNACRKESEEDLIADFVYCKDSLVSFSDNILPILQQECVSCHSGGGAEAGVKLDGYANLMNTVDSITLMAVITHENGYEPMPQGRPIMNECKINTIQMWIREGMQDN